MVLGRKEPGFYAASIGSISIDDFRKRAIRDHVEIVGGVLEVERLRAEGGKKPAVSRRIESAVDVLATAEQSGEFSLGNRTYVSMPVRGRTSYHALDEHGRIATIETNDMVHTQRTVVLDYGNHFSMVVRMPLVLGIGYEKAKSLLEKEIEAVKDPEVRPFIKPQRMPYENGENSTGIEISVRGCPVALLTKVVEVVDMVETKFMARMLSNPGI